MSEYNTYLPKSNLRKSLPISRRSAIYALGGLLPYIYTPSRTNLERTLPAKKIMLGACDWSLGYHSDPKALIEAKRIGLDGVQVSLGKRENNMHLREKNIQKRYKLTVLGTGINIASLAIGELNKYPYKSDPQTIPWVQDSIGVAKAMGCKVVLLAFFGKGDLKNDAKGHKEVIRRLRDVAPAAERAGIILGIESWLSAEEHMDIIDAVGSESIKVYYDVANSHKMGYDIYEEIKWLGDQICEVHVKENGFLFGQGRVDFKRVRECLDDIGFQGWLQLEGGVPFGADRQESNEANGAFIRETFNI